MQEDIRRSWVYQSLNYKAYAEASHVAETVNIALALAATFILKLYVVFFLPINIAAYYYMRWQARKDPWASQVYGTYNTQADFYDPWVEDRHAPDDGKRPFGFGFGLRL